MEQRDLLSNDLLINEKSQANLVASAKWGKFLAIVGYIVCLFMVLGGIYAASGMSPLSTYAYGGNDPARILGITYIITAAILFIPCLFLNKFANKAQDAIKSTSQESLELAFSSLKSMFKFYGIITIIFLVFFALAFLGGMGSAFLQ